MENNPEGKTIPSELLINARDALEFTRQFKNLFPERSKDLKMLAIIKNFKVIASGVLYIAPEV